MTASSYYTVLASLPYLPYFEYAKFLPINAQRLEKRLKMLGDEDYQIITATQAFMFWQYHSMDRTNEEFIEHYQRFTGSISMPSLLKIIEYRMDVRTIIVALRRRYYQHAAVPPKETWGIGRWVKPIEQNWNAADFNLQTVFPWIEQAVNLLHQEQVLALEKLFLGLIWNYIDRFPVPREFCLDTLVIYLLKWEIIYRWLQYQMEPAAVRLEQLLQQARGH